MSQDEKVAFMTVPQQWNRYAYCLNNPLKHIDPTGLEVYDPNVDEVARKAIHDALVEVSKHGNKQDRAMAKFILENDVTIGITGGDNATGFQDRAATQQRVNQGWVPMGEAASYIRINVSYQVAHPDSPEKTVNLQGTLVHEGKHAFDDARTMSSLSAAQGMNVVWNPTLYKAENDAYHREANYLLRRGSVGQTVGLDTNGTVNGYGMGLLTKDGEKIKVNEQKIQDIIQTTYGVNKDNQGPTTTQQYNLRPPTPK
jgi:hypothetical protein